MAVPAYTNDLVDWIIDSDTAAWGELTNAASGGVPDEADTESALQGTNTVSQATNTTSLCSQVRILGASVTLATNDVFLVWHGHGVATALLSYASGGLRLAVATTLTDWKAWAVGGNDVPPFPYGKWVNNPVDPTITGEYTNGTPPAALTFFGVGSMCILSQAVAKGQPHVTDIIRYGRAQSRFTGGESANYCVFSGFATVNDASSARWGLISTTAGGYLWKGLMNIGLSTVATTNRARNANVATLTMATGHGFRVGDILTMTGIGGTGYNVTAAVTGRTTTTITYANTGANEGTTADTGGSINGIADFRDSNTSIFIQDCRKVYSSFNKIEIRNASTNVDWSGINFVNLAPSTNASDGDFEVVDDATVAITGCSFTDMNTFIFKSNSTIDSTTFRRCALITANSADFTDCAFINSTAASTTSSTDLGDFTDCSFTSDGSNHAIELTSIGGGSMTWNGNILTGYATGATGSPVTPTSTGNEAIYVNVATASDLTINVSGGATLPSIRVGGSFTGDVNVVASANVTISQLKENTEVRVMSAGTDTELTGTDAATNGTLNNRSYTFSLSAGVTVDIFLVNVLYENIEIYGYVIPSADATLPQQQRLDRVYLNP